MRKFVLGDIHGSKKCLKQVLANSEFDFKEDKLIFLGDICDGWSEFFECIELLNRVDNLVAIRGNHDEWLKKYAEKNQFFMHFFDGEMNSWLHHGGQITKEKYDALDDEKKQVVIDYLNKTKFYHVEDNCLFVHGGYSRSFPLETQDQESMMWDRSVVNYVYAHQNKEKFDERFEMIYVGHTPLQSFGNGKFDANVPQVWTNVCLMDTGCAFSGVLSMMNIETKEVFSSEPSMIMYPDEPGRNGMSFNQIIENKKKEE